MKNAHRRTRVRYAAASAFVFVLLLGVWLLVGGTGSEPRPAASVASAGTTRHVAEPAGPTPSESAQMVCAPEAQKDLASVLGVSSTAVETPTWVDHLYSCRYDYADGAMTLSVKELSSKAQTSAYFDSLRTQFGKKRPVVGLGQGAFVTTNGSVVVRKDYKVLLVDTSGLPARFGPFSANRAKTAIDVGVTVLGCWTGA
ncbi:MAG: hypothetical protein E6G60_22385 [Actinobacteria bacterium]|nr:MAG: hypothetical protein E6G60_22385 [Actinomycetota bacterium]